MPACESCRRACDRGWGAVGGKREEGEEQSEPFVRPVAKAGLSCAEHLRSSSDLVFSAVL